MGSRGVILAVWLVLAASVVAAEDAAPLVRFSRSEVHMGVEFEVVLYGANAKQADLALSKAMARIAALDKALSDYDLESELSKLSETSNREGEAAAVRVSDDLWAVLSQAQQISATSEGAFDVTIGPLSKLWRRARRWKELPEAEALAAARQGVGYRALVLDPFGQTAKLTKPNMRLDLGGIGKGYAVDEAVKAVVGCGITQVLARASGDIACADAPPGERGWRIGIAPLDPSEPPTRFVELANCGVSTSGDARQHLIVDGRRYSHIIDPRTGECVRGRSSVTVIAPRGMLADGLDTAASVLGPDGAKELMQKFAEVEMLMVYEDESERQRTVETERFRKYE
jgi:thiamine biosynthesis lipoprotein